MLSQELSSAEKRDRLRALIPADVCKIEDLNQATPAQLKQLKEAIEVAEALRQLERSDFYENNLQRGDKSV